MDGHLHVIGFDCNFKEIEWLSVLVLIKLLHIQDFFFNALLVHKIVNKV